MLIFAASLLDLLSPLNLGKDLRHGSREGKGKGFSNDNTCSVLTFAANLLDLLRPLNLGVGLRHGSGGEGFSTHDTRNLFFIFRPLNLGFALRHEIRLVIFNFTLLKLKTLLDKK
jgi:hypothetical protein